MTLATTRPASFAETTMGNPHQHTNRTDHHKPEPLADVIERARGRLQVLEYACFGMKHVSGKEARCLPWIIEDIIRDLERVREGA